MGIQFVNLKIHIWFAEVEIHINFLEWKYTLPVWKYTMVCQFGLHAKAANGILFGRLSPNQDRSRFISSHRDLYQDSYIEKMFDPWQE